LAIKSDATREMYRGVTEILDETVARALERHLRHSSQVLARVRVDVVPGEPPRVQGLVVERLPRPGGGEAWDAADFEATLAALDALTPDALAAEVAAGSLLGRPLDVLEERPLSWRCTCSRERVEAMLLTLGADELAEMLRDDRGAEVTCEFCREVYGVEEAELGALLARARA